MLTCQRLPQPSLHQRTNPAGPISERDHSTSHQRTVTVRLDLGVAALRQIYIRCACWSCLGGNAKRTSWCQSRIALPISPVLCVWPALAGVRVSEPPTLLAFAARPWSPGRHAAGGAASRSGRMIQAVHTTPPSPIDIAQVFPQVIPFVRTTVRLHPRKGSPGIGQSSMGGPLLWPAQEPWPTCQAAGLDDHPDDKDAGVPLVPVLQLTSEDVPELPFPDGTDILQVLWCPFDHDPWCAPHPQLLWRRRSDIGARREMMPDVHEDADPAHIPGPCVLDPERVTEYPAHDLPRDVWPQIRETVKRIEADTGWQYDTDLAVASGTKTGGYPGWTQLPDWPVCECGTQMQHLLTVASWEFSRGDEKRWIPLQDRPAMAGWGFNSSQNHPWRAIQNPAGLMLGDAGGIYLFVCVQCPRRPYEHRFDCS